jgi:hypothetical protein
VKFVSESKGNQAICSKIRNRRISNFFEDPNPTFMVYALKSEDDHQQTNIRIYAVTSDDDPPVKSISRLCCNRTGMKDQQNQYPGFML